MKKYLLFVLAIYLLSSCTTKKTLEQDSFVIADGQMPNLVKDNEGNIHLVFGMGDSLLYAYSSDQGKSFSTPAIVGVLPELAASHTRGPQIANTINGLTVIVCNDAGDIFSYSKAVPGNWNKSGRVNDVDTVAKENLIALGAEGAYAFAVWLDVRGNGQNKIYGSKSSDGGKTWSSNKMIYTSPDTTVCQCCKPSVIVKGGNIYVMFRNWLKGDRDMYLIQSKDGGESFGQAQKLGTASWKLNGCPMDGGSLAVNNNDSIQTVWRREGKVYSSIPGMPEKEIGQGKGCTIETVNGKNVFAWTENGEVVVVTPEGQKKLLGKGTQPVVKALNNDKVICVWENEMQIHASVLEL